MNELSRWDGPLSPLSPPRCSDARDCNRATEASESNGIIAIETCCIDFCVLAFVLLPFLRRAPIDSIPPNRPHTATTSHHRLNHGCWQRGLALRAHRWYVREPLAAAWTTDGRGDVNRIEWAPLRAAWGDPRSIETATISPHAHPHQHKHFTTAFRLLYYPLHALRHGKLERLSRRMEGPT